MRKTCTDILETPGKRTVKEAIQKEHYMIEKIRKRENKTEETT